MNAQPSNASSLARIGLVALAIGLAFALLIFRLVRWQVLERSLLLDNHKTTQETSQLPRQDRGTIVDRRGDLLAVDTYRWEIWVEPWLSSKEDAPILAERLVGILGPELIVSKEELQNLLASGERTTYTIARRAPQVLGEAIAAWEDEPAVGALPVPVRYYPQRSLAAHVLGFVNYVHDAYYGTEQYYDEYLRIVDAPFFQSQAGSREAYAALSADWTEHLPSLAAQDLVLTIDRRIQFTVEQILAEALGKYDAEAGTIIVMDPYTGAILASASLPAYDPNQYGLAQERLLADPAISRQYEPGSVFKIVTLAAGIDAGLITPETIITDTETMEVGGRVIQNSDRQGHGQVTIREVLVESLNVGSAGVALMLGESLFYQYVGRFGFGQLTEVDLANEVPGTVKVPGDVLWSRSDLATNAFGQGLAVTPLQMTAATAVIANGGQLVRPHVVDSMVFRARVLRPDRAPVRRVIQPETASMMADMMTDVGGDVARRSGFFDNTIAGKTGTAQVAIDGAYHPTLTIASFVGFAPVEDPQFVALVKLDKPKTSPWAVHTAAPTFVEVARRLLHLMHVPPQRLASQP